MTPIRLTLMAILLFVAIGVGSFIYFIANWDAARTGPTGWGPSDAPSFFSSKILRGLGQSPSPANAIRTTA